jgi:hypothetical protein
MKTKMSVSIPKACHEAWSNLVPTSNGGYCNTCSKTVVDFSTLSDEAILNFFTNKPLDTCGRFRVDQLKTYSHREPMIVNPGLTLLKVGVISLFMLLIAKQATAQTSPIKTTTETIMPGRVVQNDTTVKQHRIITGVVRSEEDNAPLAGVNIYVKDTTIGTTSDVDGRFELPEGLHTGDVLVFNYIGLDTKEFTITRDVNTIDLSMAFSAMVMMGEVAVDEVYEAPPSTIARWWEKVKQLF